MQRFLFNFRIAFEQLFHNKLRSFLTALGIIFGVASVIAMMAIGEGARKEIMDQMKLVGLNNIVIKHKVKTKSENSEQDISTRSDKKEASLGLSMEDANAIRTVLPQVEKVSPEISFNVFAIHGSRGKNVKLIGVSHEYFNIQNLNLAEGTFFSSFQDYTNNPVCVIGEGIENYFFSNKSAIDKRIKCGNVWFKVIGVLKGNSVSEEAKTSLGINDMNLAVYAPSQTILIRFKNRGLITKSTFIRRTGNDEYEFESSVKTSDYHQIDNLIVQVKETAYLEKTAEVISTMLRRRHNGVEDFEITIPELLIKQEQRNTDIFNAVLGVIAGISLLVGGIGIMNIMLVSVMERLREIGLRMALGAKKLDVIQQFLAEAVMLSSIGGIVGVILGYGLSVGISRSFDILTIVTPFSVILSFVVAFLVGLLSGLAPARKAALQDPIMSLRHD